MGESSKEHLREMLASFDTAMLVTNIADQPHARPMAVAAVDGANTLWFVTHDATPKTEEIVRDARVSATFQSRTKFVALSGTAELVDDRAKVAELWKPDWKVWFPNGKDDPSIRLIRVHVSDAEFWDNAGTKGIRYAFEAAKAVLKGETPKPVAGAHGRVETGNGEANAPRPRH